MIPYIWLSLAILCLWIPPQAGSTYWSLRHLLSAGWLTVAVAHGLMIGIITPVGVATILVFGVLCIARSAVDPRRVVERAMLTAGVVAGSVALMGHVAPGFHNRLIVRDAVLSAGAVPFTLFLNFDKAQIGLCLLAVGPPLLQSAAAWRHTLAAMLPRLLVTLSLVMVYALLVGQIRVEAKWPDVFPFWAWANLMFTCTAEEALFRGLIQRELQGETAFAEKRRSITSRVVWGWLVASVLFGVAHFAGGTQSIVLATIAGMGYGWVYWRTGRIEASILAHFLLNTVHILFFTYPALHS